MRRWWIMAIVAMLALTIATPAASARKASSEIPMRGLLVGKIHWEYPAPDSECSVVTTVTDSVGFVMGMGFVSARWTHCPAEEIDQDGRVVFKTRRGHELLTSYEYDDTEDGVTTLTVIGGKGRFADATGSLTAKVDFVPQLKPGCTDDDDFDCLDFDTPWPWWGTVKGSVSR